MENYTFLTFDMPDGALRGASGQGGGGFGVLLRKACSASSLILDKKLTKREFYCLVLAAHGMTSIETSKLLCIAKDTVESHKKNVRHKLKSKNMVNAVFQAIRYELNTRINADPALVGNKR